MDELDPGWLTDLDAAHDDPGAVAGYYDRWAEGYDADLESWDYRAPVRAASLLLAEAPGARLVLDAGCGTGLAGGALRRAGFDGELHGIDLSQASLDVVARSDAYQHLARVDLQQPLEIDDGRYDALLCVGVMAYIPQVRRCWTEFCRVVAPGGVVVVTQREDLWRDHDCGQIAADLAASGRWEPLLVTEAEPYLPDSPDELAALGVRYLVARIPSV